MKCKAIPRFALAAGAALFLWLSCQSACAQSAHAESIPQAPPQAALRVATWNVHDCSASNKKTGQTFLLHAQIARTLHELKIDIIALQEIQIEGRKGADIQLLQNALEHEGWPMPFAAWVKSPQADDLAILSRFPIVQNQVVLEPSKAPWPRPVLEAHINVAGRELVLYNAHFKAFDDAKSLAARRAQASALASLLRAQYGDRIKGAAIILAGDFNTIMPEDMAPNTGTLDMLQLRDNEDPSDDFLSASLKWRYPEPTFISARYSSITDHLIISPALAAHAGKNDIAIVDAPDSGYGFPLSDHKILILSLLISDLPLLSR
jgi:endonuclease/exonuclease/phosphatase family metal-dependent hydrolase